jgi:hypothetical protein
MPAPIVPQDGMANNEGERHAATRFLSKRRQDTRLATALSPQTGAVPMLPTSRRCMITGATLCSG